MSKWRQDPNAYYLRYLSDNKIGDEPQNQAMAVGSAFDAYVKSFLYEHLFGPPSAPGNDETFDKERIFTEQVEPQNRDFARDVGDYLFGQYRKLGALDQLMLDLGRCKGKPRFEMDIRGKASVGRNGVVKEVPFRVKPDLCYVNEQDATVVFDWKVNGYMSQGKSPTPGFVRARRSGELPWAHAKCKLGTHKGLTVNVANGLEVYDEDWARQCSVGGWMFGCQIGSDFVACIHQLACKPRDVGKPTITVAEHVGFVTPSFQWALFDEAVALWEAINSDHVFRHLSIEDSKALCDVLDQRKATLAAGSQGFLAPILDD